MDANNQFVKLKQKLISEINKIDFEILKQNWNKIFQREKHTRIIYDEDEVVSILEEEWYGDNFFLKEKLIKYINYMCEQFAKNTRNSPEHNFNFLIDNYYWLIEALAITLNLDFKKYLNLYKNL